MEIRIINEAAKDDINIKNEPFELFGNLLLSYSGGKWSYDEYLLDKRDVCTMCFPDENYDFAPMNKDCIFVGAYDRGECIGLAVLQEHFLKYMYLKI